MINVIVECIVHNGITGFIALNASNASFALERQTRRIVGVAFGDRTAETCRRLWQSLRPDYRKRAICYSDFWEPSAKVLPVKRIAPWAKRVARPPMKKKTSQWILQFWDAYDKMA